MMYGRERSDPVIVVMKSPNKTGEPAAEAMERRAGAKENASQHRTCRTQSRESVSQTPERVRTAEGLAVTIRGGSRMRESRSSGFVRGDRGNPVPYRHRHRLRTRRSANLLDVGSRVTGGATPLRALNRVYGLLPPADAHPSPSV